MSDQTTTAASVHATPERHWSPAPAYTLLAVIVLWYVGVAGLLLSQVF